MPLITSDQEQTQRPAGMLAVLVGVVVLLGLLGFQTWREHERRKAVAEFQARMERELSPGRKAMRLGFADPLEPFTRDGADPRRVTPLGHTVLMHAALQESPELARFALEHGVDARAVASDGLDAFHFAALSRSGEVGRVLLEHGVPVDGVSASSPPPLRLAAENGNLPLVRLLLEHHAQRDLDGTLSQARRDYAQAKYLAARGYTHRQSRVAEALARYGQIVRLLSQRHAELARRSKSRSQGA